MANPHNEIASAADTKPAAPTDAVNDPRAILSHDADLSTPRTMAQADGPGGPNADMLKMLGPEKDYPAREHAEMRQQFHLKPDASSKDLFEAVANAAFTELKNGAHNPAVRAEQDKELHALGLTRDGLTPAKIFEAQMAQRMKETGVKDPHDYAAMELIAAKKFYADVKAGKSIPIDYD